ncbi:MAG: PadR family transcriptional regulator [Solirubrobacterales bacterium]|nr:PadR family transcriptional regulator [Solirubrobacterales bacterium]MCB0860580.1 PadR family transcriptional regulator [Solirubrobacterales bacterium]HRV59870.1 PadR family transcriptional regulator [Solirubrobacterales bacterium]
MYESDFDPRDRGRFEDSHDHSGFGPDAGPRGRRHRHGPGRGGPRGHGGGPRGRGPGRGRRARRGDIRQAILLLLEDEPRNGYGLMQEVEDRSGGSWRPSPGSVYPALSQLEDEGLVEMNESGGRKEFSLTDAGKNWVEEHRDEIGSPWDTEGRGMPKELGSLRKSTQALAMAARQLAHTGTTAQLEEARKIVDEARRKLYGILAQSEEEQDQGQGQG